jgi:hypothetical protein
LANASAALANAQAQLIANQPASMSQDHLIQQADRLLTLAGNLAARLRAKRTA